MKGNFLEAIIGAIVLIVSGFFMYFAITTSGEKIKNGYTLTARFEDVTGLTSGADVKMNGIKIGIVQSLSLDKDYSARVEMVINNKYKIPSDSGVSVSTDGIMGNKFIAISCGYADDVLKPGDEIEDTKSSVNLEKLVDKFIAKAGQGGGDDDKKSTGAGAATQP